MKDFQIVMENTLENNRVSVEKYLDLVFSIYKGRFKKNSEIEEHNSDKWRLQTYRMEVVDLPSTIIVSYSPKSSIISIDIDNGFFYDGYFTEEQIKQNFVEFIDLARAMMQAANAKFMIGSNEINSISPLQDVPIRLFYFNDQDYLPFLQKHIEKNFKFELTLKELGDLVNRYADIKKIYKDYTLVCFYPFLSKKSKGFYKKIKEIAEKRKTKSQGKNEE